MRPRGFSAAARCCAMGRWGPMLYGRGVIFINRCYDELNVTQPELVRAVHTEYLQAGAVVIETNTFGANRAAAGAAWAGDAGARLNVAGVRLARECVEQMRAKQASEAFVAGAIGPLGVRMGGDAKVSEEEAYGAFAEQVRALAEGGPGVGADLLVIETMTSHGGGGAGDPGGEAGGRGAAGDRDGDGGRAMGNCLDGTTAEDAARRKMTEWGADAVGCNCSEGPAIVLSVIERMRGRRPAAGGDAECGDAEGGGGEACIPVVAGVHGELCEEVCEGGGDVCGGVLRHDAEGTSRAMRGALRALDAQAAGVEDVGAGEAAVRESKPWSRRRCVTARRLAG